MSVWQKTGVKRLINAQALKNTIPPVRHTVMQMRYGWRRPLILALNSHPSTFFCLTDLLSAPRHATDFSKLDGEREREWDGHSLQSLISVQGACTKREMNMFAFDTADPETAAVFLRVCASVCCVGVCCLPCVLCDPSHWHLATG